MDCDTTENLRKLLREKLLETDSNLNKDFQLSDGEFNSEFDKKYPEIIDYSNDGKMRLDEKNPFSQSSLSNSSSKLGCHVNELISREIQYHLTTDNYSHGNLLIEWINNMTNEIGSLNKEMKSLKTEIKLLKEKKENKNNQLIFNELLFKPSEREIINLDKIKLSNEKKQIEPNFGLKEVIKLISDLSSILNQLDEVCKEFDILKQTQIDDSENVMEILTELDKKQKLLFSKLNKANQNTEILIEKSSQMEEAVKILDNRTRRQEEKICNFDLRIDRQNYGYFIWNIRNYSDKLKTSQNWADPVFYSDPFYTHKHGYRLCLCVYPDGNCDAKGTYLSVYFCVVRGQFDNILSWPIKPSVTIELIDQQAGQIHVSKTADYEDYPNSESWNKPISEKNNGIGFCKFIKLEELKQIPTLTNDDQIFIKCSVNLEL